MTILMEEYIEYLEGRKQTLMEGLCTKGKNETETEYERGKIAELKQQISHLKRLNESGT